PAAGQGRGSLTLVAAALADGRAGLQQRPGHVGVVLRRSAQDADGDGAEVGALQAQPDAPHHLGEVPFAQVGVDVGRADPGWLIVSSPTARWCSRNQATASHSMEMPADPPRYRPWAALDGTRQRGERNADTAKSSRPRVRK